MSQRECIDLVIRGLEEKMQEEVKKPSKGKPFEEICKIVYHLKNSSTKPAKDPQQTTLTSSNSTSNGINAFGNSGHGRGGGGGRSGGRGGDNPGTPLKSLENRLTTVYFVFYCIHSYRERVSGSAHSSVSTFPLVRGCQNAKTNGARVSKRRRC